MLINVDVCVTDSDVSVSWHFHNGSEQQFTRRRRTQWGDNIS